MSDYQNASPKQFGNLHERMKYLVNLIQSHERGTPQEVWNAIFDLETEVQGHKPAKPPFGRRPEPLTK